MTYEEQSCCSMTVSMLPIKNASDSRFCMALVHLGVLCRSLLEDFLKNESKSFRKQASRNLRKPLLYYDTSTNAKSWFCRSFVIFVFYYAKLFVGIVLNTSDMCKNSHDLGQLYVDWDI